MAIDKEYLNYVVERMSTLNVVEYWNKAIIRQFPSERNSPSSYELLVCTAGWNNAFMSTCTKFGFTDIIEWYSKLEWEESDEVDLMLAEAIFPNMCGNISAPEASLADSATRVDDLVIVDIAVKGNIVRFYLGTEQQFNDSWGDDWDDAPYEHNAGEVYDEYVSALVDVAFPFDAIVLEPKDDWAVNRGNSRWSKQDMKNRAVPCLAAAMLPDNADAWRYEDSFSATIGIKIKDALLFYYGDQLAPNDWMTIINVKKISAFQECSSLTTVTIPGSVQNIQDYVFCGSDITSVKIPYGVTNINGYTFCCSSLEEIDIPDSVTSLGYNCFESTQLKTVVIPDSVRSISSEAFRGCNQLETVVLSSNIRYLRSGIFNDCEALQSVTWRGTTYTSASELTAALQAAGCYIEEPLFANSGIDDYEA